MVLKHHSQLGGWGELPMVLKLHHCFETKVRTLRGPEQPVHSFGRPRKQQTARTRSSEAIFLERLFGDPPSEQKLSQCGAAEDSRSRLLLNHLALSLLSCCLLLCSACCLLKQRRDEKLRLSRHKFTLQNRQAVLAIDFFFFFSLLLSAFKTVFQPLSHGTLVYHEIMSGLP